MRPTPRPGALVLYRSLRNAFSRLAGEIFLVWTRYALVVLAPARSFNAFFSGMIHGLAGGSF
eukprot:scaffold76429_cov63-Phaeocystis_antarctica.AAC.2